jgi:trehalose 6-phosphate synthase
VAAQDPDDPGVLILSRFAGAAHELDSAILVNPYDTESTARAIARALDMPWNERRDRWTSMMEKLKRNGVKQWRQNFLAVLAAPSAPDADAAAEGRHPPGVRAAHVPG